MATTTELFLDGWNAWVRWDDGAEVYTWDAVSRTYADAPYAWQSGYAAAASVNESSGLRPCTAASRVNDVPGWSLATRDGDDRAFFALDGFLAEPEPCPSCGVNAHATCYCYRAVAT